MTERLKSGQNQSCIVRLLSRLRIFKDHLEERKKFDKREFFNDDRTKKFVVGYNDINVGYENVSLYAQTLRKEGIPLRTVEGWNIIMSITKWIVDEKTTFVIEVGVVSDDPHHLTQQFHYDPQGYLVEDHMYSWVQKEYRQEHKQRLVSLGCYKYADLPQRIDYESTGKLFLLQAHNLNFQTPQLIPYDFQAIGNQDPTSLIKVEL